MESNKNYIIGIRKAHILMPCTQIPSQITLTAEICSKTPCPCHCNAIGADPDRQRSLTVPRPPARSYRQTGQFPPSVRRRKNYIRSRLGRREKGPSAAFKDPKPAQVHLGLYAVRPSPPDIKPRENGFVPVTHQRLKGTEKGLKWSGGSGSAAPPSSDLGS